MTLLFIVNICDSIEQFVLLENNSGTFVFLIVFKNVFYILTRLLLF